jgi:predicted Zn-dependent protease
MKVFKVDYLLMTTTRTVLIIIICVLCNGCARSSTSSQQQYSHPEAPYSTLMYSKSDLEEIYVGTEIHKELTAQYSTYKNDEIEKYITEIGNILTQFAERKTLPYQFTILNDERIYAVAAPGGFVYVTTGLIYFLDNEAELAGVLAHEIALIQQRDPRLSSKKKYIDAVTQGGTTIGPLFGSYGSLAAIGIQLLHAYMYSERNLENKIDDADRIALEYLINASYDPQGFIDFLYKIIYSDSNQRKLLLHYLSSHPITMQRMDSINNYFNELSLTDKSFDVGREKFNEMTKPIRDLYVN